jgi:hypothetical protein
MDYPRPSWRPEYIVKNGDVVDKISLYTNHQKPFVIYENGTCVFPSIIDENLQFTCDEILTNVVMSSPDFKVNKMNDGNFMVSFLGPVYSLVFEDTFNKNKKNIIESVDAKGLLSGEKVISSSDSSSPLDHYYIGLYARAYLYMDAADRHIVNFIKNGI